MKLLVLGLDCAAPEILLQDAALPTIRRLMQQGRSGPLESVIPPITVPAWMCLATGQDPGALGVYGFRNRRDWTYDGLSTVTSRSIDAPAWWDAVAARGGVASILGVPPNYPPRAASGVSVGCFLTPDCRQGLTHPAEFQAQLQRWVGPYVADVADFRRADRAALAAAIRAASEQQFRLLRHVLRETPWDFVHFVEIGLDRIQHAFWKQHDPRHRAHEPGHPWSNVVRDYYQYLDAQIAQTLDGLKDETLVLIVSDHGARALDGGFCINQWLIEQGYLCVHALPATPTPLAKLDVDWSRTRAWSEGGYYARVFLNVQGREPQGVIAPADYERTRDELAAKLRALPDDQGRPLGTLVYRPEEIYTAVRGFPPDLIALFGGLAWRSVGSVGRPSVYTFDNDTGPDDCNHAQFGAYVLSGPGAYERGVRREARLVELAAEVLELAGYDPLPHMRRPASRASAAVRLS